VTTVAVSRQSVRPSKRVDAVDQSIVWRIRRASICMLLFAGAFMQQPGRLVADTKLDLTQAPGEFLVRATQLWDPVGFAGQVQNQAYGYLFPIGPFFALGDAIAIPGWVVQRLWWGVVLSVAFTGITTLCRRLSIGTGWTQILAGIAFALSPRMLSTIGPVSAEAWPMALAPWVIVPLVVASRTGHFRRAAMISGLAVALMGGVNAALTLAAIVPAAIYIATRRPVGRALRLAGWWVLSVLMATLWWLVPLVLLGRYSPPFLDYIETADVTTSPTALVPTLRGASHWVAYLGPELGSRWQAGYDLVSISALVFATVLVLGVGVVGLSLRGMPERGWLVTMLVLGCIAVTFGHAGPGTPWFAPQAADLLDGVLAPLRNVHKFDPLIRIPVVLGLAYATAVVPRILRRLDGGRFAAAGAIGVVIIGVAAGAAPAAADRVAPEGAFTGIPGYWADAAGWLADHDDGRTLLVPGSRFGVYGWGSPMDEPIQTLGDVPWEVRNAIPLVPPGHIRMLDAAERQFASGTPSAGLAPYLARSGISHLLVRNDLDPVASQATWPAIVHETLDGSPGLKLEASFGPNVAAKSTEGLFVDHGIGQADYPALEIYSVSDAQPEVSLTPDDEVVEVVGGPESLLDLSDANVIGPTQPSVLAAQNPAGPAVSKVVLTDTLQRREVTFGRSLDNASRVLTDSDPLRFDRPQNDYEVTSDPRKLTVADWEGASYVRVSSSLADVTAGDDLDLSAGPAAAFDGSPATAWRTLRRETTLRGSRSGSTSPAPWRTSTYACRLRLPRRP
jgi:arabinofuranan 3-O-arabinosyltransferase